ncbi:nuclear pore complex protein Nup153 isoform X2 [Patella vulgata]|uniref:nuclear pore complex protein Nup153 isoform X2 n=1 Tax=Patella vulgata TaxID=6465 RepID=UPI0021806344|nr:nuclear pore complex protein Nup153 isoform X2 [Patella vulgata]
MATDGGGKLKPKRSQPAQKPYERRKSLYKKVTDTVKDLLSPSWLTDIVSTVKKSPPKQNYPSTLDEDEDEMFMSPPQSPNQVNSYSGPPRIASQLENKLPAPQPKRSRVPVPSVSLNNPAFGSSTSHPGGSFSSSQLPLSRYGTSTNNPSTSTNRNVVTRSPIHDNVSHLATGYSFEQQTNLLNLNEKELQQIKDNLSTGQTKSTSDSEDQHSRTMARNTSLKTDGSSQRARVWQNEVCQPIRPIEPVVTDKPSFKASLFGSPVIDTSLLGDDVLNQSSFYPGKTTFGGSSSVRNRSRLNVTAPYQTALPIRKHMTPKLANNSFSAVTSSSARRILESLERMSTPLSDVKKIPMEVPSVSDSLFSFTPSSYRRQSRSFQPSVLSRRSLDVPIRSGPPTSQIRTHSIASISRNRQTVTSTPISSRKVSLTQEDSNETQEASKRKEDNDGISAQLPRDKLYETPSSSSWGAGGGKMKRDKTHHYSSKRPEDDDIMEIPSLKADFTLPVSNLPQIHFTATPIVKVDDDMAKCISETNKGELKFSFSSPVHQSQTPVNVESPGSNVKSFTFSSPLKADDKSKDAQPSTVAFTFMSTPTTAPKLKTTSVLGNGGVDCKSNQLSSKTEMNKSNLANFTSKSDSFKSSPVLKSGSVMDILGNGSSPKTLKQGSVMDILGKNSTTSPVSTLKEGSVMDIQNKKDKNTVEPEFRKADTVKITATEGTITGNKESLSSLFSKPSGAWSCDICMVQNNPDKTKCAACEAPRPGSKPPVGSITGNKESLSSLFSKPSGAWSCDICMVQNNPDKTKCAACETPRPGSKPSEGNSNTLSSGIKFGSSGAGTITDSGFKINTVDSNKTNTSACGFKFGSTDSTTPVTTGGFKFTDSQSSDKVSFATDNKLSDKTTTGFSFGSKDTTSSNPKTDTGFAFGNPKSSGEQKSETGFTFGNPKASGGEKSETGFNFGIAKSTDEGQAGSGFSFSPPASSDNKTDNMAFGQTKTDDVNVSSGFSLGAQSNSIFGGNTNLEKGFQFNQPLKTADNSNSSQTNTNGQSSTGGFVFGASDSKNKIQETNNNNLVKDKSVEIKSGFSFGQSAPSSVGGFNMGSNSVLGDSQQKLPNDFTFGGSTTNTNTGGLGVFSSAPTGNLTNTNNTSFTSSKRTIDDDSDEPKAKKSFVFGASSSTAPNGPFDSKPTVAVQPETKNTAGPVFNFSANSTQQPNNTGFNFGVSTPNVPVFKAVTKKIEKQSDSLFTFGGGGVGNNSQSFGNTSNNFSGAPAAFGSSSFGGNGSTSGSTIGSTQATNAPAFGASSATPAFGASGQTSAFGNSSNAGFQFSATPNLSFTGNSGSSTFQFSGKSNESGNATTAQTPQTPAFAFGGPGPAAVAPTTSFTAPNFGTPGQPGSFNIGAGATDRKIKKAVRRKR